MSDSFLCQNYDHIFYAFARDLLGKFEDQIHNLRNLPKAPDLQPSRLDAVSSKPVYVVPEHRSSLLNYGLA